MAQAANSKLVSIATNVHQPPDLKIYGNTYDDKQKAEVSECICPSSHLESR